MSEQLEGVDVSVWGGAIDQATWRKLYAAGQRVAVVGSAHPRPNPYAQNNLLGARSAGLKIATYAALYPGVTGNATIDKAKEMCGAAWDFLSFVAVDAEVDGITSAQISDAIRRVKALGKRPVIYTAYWWWHDHFGDSSAFAAFPLWNAYYDNDPDYDFEKHPYGGWTIESVMGEQYGNTQTLEGVSVDRNSFRADFINAENGGQDEMTDQDFAKVKAIVEASEADTKNWVTQEVKSLLNAMVFGFKNIDGDTEAIKKKLGI